MRGAAPHPDPVDRWLHRGMPTFFYPVDSRGLYNALRSFELGSADDPGAIYVDSVSGSGGNSGLTRASPVATIAQAMAVFSSNPSRKRLALRRGGTYANITDAMSRNGTSITDPGGAYSWGPWDQAPARLVRATLGTGLADSGVVQLFNGTVANQVYLNLDMEHTQTHAIAQADRACGFSSHFNQSTNNLIVQGCRFTRTGIALWLGGQSSAGENVSRNIAFTYNVLPQPAAGDNLAGNSVVVFGIDVSDGSDFRNVITYRNWILANGVTPAMNHNTYHIRSREAQTEGNMFVGAGGYAIDHKYGSHTLFKGNFAAHGNMGYQFGSLTESDSGPIADFDIVDCWVTQPKYRVALTGGENIADGPIGWRIDVGSTSTPRRIRAIRFGASAPITGTRKPETIALRGNAAGDIDFIDSAFMGTQNGEFGGLFFTRNNAMKLNVQRTTFEFSAISSLLVEAWSDSAPLPVVAGTWSGNIYRCPNVGDTGNMMRYFGNYAGFPSQTFNRAQFAAVVGESVPASPAAPNYSAYNDFDYFANAKGFATTDAYITRVRASWLGGTGANDLRDEFAGDEAVRMVQLKYGLPSGYYAGGSGGTEGRRNSGRPGVLRI
jgi:hypothetical protein